MLHLVWSRERNDKTLTPTPTGIFLLTASDWEFWAACQLLMIKQSEVKLKPILSIMLDAGGFFLRVLLVNCLLLLRLIEVIADFGFGLV